MEEKKASSFVLNRNFTLASTKGHVIHFEKGKPTHVPPSIVREALSIGAVPEDGSEPDIDLGGAAPKPPSDPAERNPLIMVAIEELVAANTREDFTAAGAPTKAAVSRVTGFPVDQREITAAWQEYHKAQADKAEG